MEPVSREQALDQAIKWLGHNLKKFKPALGKPAPEGLDKFQVWLDHASDKLFLLDRRVPKSSRWSCLDLRTGMSEEVAEVYFYRECSLCGWVGKGARGR